MTDFAAWILNSLARILVAIFGIVLIPWAYILSFKQKRFNFYKYESARGWDILANKKFAPVFNKMLVIKGGRQFGQDETISQCMAWNKVNGFDSKTAKVVEKIINIFDKDHLEKTYKKTIYYSL